LATFWICSDQQQNYGINMIVQTAIELIALYRAKL